VNAITLTLNELKQLTSAIEQRSKGATVEEALRVGFGVKKGGSEGYKRAKLLFDTATALPSGGAQ
jgi:hypothetical protein